MRGLLAGSSCVNHINLRGKAEKMQILTFLLVRVVRDGFRQRVALGHLSFWRPTQV